MENVLGLIITLILMGLLFYLVMWFVGWVGVPEPFNKVIKVVIGIVVLIYLFGIITGHMPAPNYGRWWK
jgi:VIT1/CCC1 family predicted Fe2+/Mn2+ transporter